MNLPASNRVKAITTSLAVAVALVGAGVGIAQARSSSDLADGTYLYGQVAQPNQISKGYVVFQHRNGEVVGALYHPRSEFQCFKGDLKDTTLEIQPIATETAVRNETTAELNQLHRINTISANDRRILAACQQVVATGTNLPESTPSTNRLAF